MTSRSVPQSVFHMPPSLANDSFHVIRMHAPRTLYRTPTTPVKGFSLIEMMVVIIVTTLLLLLAVPSFTGISTRNQLRNAVEQLRSDLNLAKTESRRRNRNVTVSFTRNDDGSVWCYGLTLAAECDCTVSDPADDDFCELDPAIRNVVSSEIYEGVTLDAVPFVDGLLLFSAARPTIESGSASFTSRDNQIARVVMSSMGRLRLCSPAGEHKLYYFDPC